MATRWRLSLLLLLGVLYYTHGNTSSHFLSPSVWGTDATRIGLRGMGEQVAQIGTFEHTTMFGEFAATPCHPGYYLAYQPVDEYENGDEIKYYTFTSSSPLAMGGLEKGKPSQVIAALIHSGLDASLGHRELPSSLHNWKANSPGNFTDFSVLQLLSLEGTSGLQALDPLVAFDSGTFVIHDTDLKVGDEQVEIRIAVEVVSPPARYYRAKQHAADDWSEDSKGFVVTVTCSKDSFNVEHVQLLPYDDPVVGVVNGKPLLKGTESYEVEDLGIELSGEAITINSYLYHSTKDAYFFSGTAKTLTVSLRGTPTPYIQGTKDSPTQFFTVQFRNDEVTNLCSPDPASESVASWFQDQVIKEDKLYTLGFISPHEGTDVTEGETFSVDSCCIPVSTSITSFVATLSADDLSCLSILLFSDQEALEQKNARGTLLAVEKWSQVDVVVGVDNPISLFNDFSLSASVTNLPIMTLGIDDEEPTPDHCSASGTPPAPSSTPTPTPTRSPSRGASPTPTRTKTPIAATESKTDSGVTQSADTRAAQYEEGDSSPVDDADASPLSSDFTSGMTALTSKEEASSVVAMNKSWVTYVVFIVGILVVVGGAAGYLLMKKARTNAVVATRGRSGSTDERPLNRFSQMEEEYNDHDV